MIEQEFKQEYFAALNTELKRCANKLRDLKTDGVKKPSNLSVQEFLKSLDELGYKMSIERK